MVVAALPLTTLSADAAVTGGQSIEVFLGSNLVSLTGYPPNTDVRVQVFRQGFEIGFATKTTDAEGAIEMNHVGGSDCFESPTSPDIMPRDTVRTTVVGTTNVDSSVMRGVWIDDIQYGVPNANTIRVSGRVTLSGPSSVTPGQDVLELRINKDTVWDVNDRPGRIDRREDIGASVNPNGTWVHDIVASVDDVNEAEASSENFLEWSAGGETEAFPSELTVAEFGPGEAIAGCPPEQRGPTAPRLAPAQDSGKRGDHITNRSANLDFGGLVGMNVAGEPGPGAAVTLLVDGVERGAGTANTRGVYSFPNLDLKPRAKAYALRVRAQSAGEPVFTSPTRNVRIDNARPAVRTRTFRPNPLHLNGLERVHSVFRIGEASVLQAKIQHVRPTRTVQTMAKRTIKGARLVEVNWDGKNEIRRDVRPGLYRMVLTVTDRAGNRSLEINRFRVVR
jgi:hypothetical protein